MQDYIDYIKKHKITMGVTCLRQRSDDKSWKGGHYVIVLKIDGRGLRICEYSVGTGHLEGIIRKHWRKLGLAHEIGYDIRINLSADRYAGLLYAAAKMYKPTIEDVLLSLAMDAQCGDSSFSNFCNELDYDSDSIKAKATWKACNDSYYALRDGLGHLAYDELMECEE